MSVFEAQRARLTGLAYRMLGGVSEAEDIVQDAYLRWREVEATGIANPAGYLSTIVTRLCLDRLKSARARREDYVGSWLPEPIVTDPSADALVDLANDLSVAMLLALERTSPLERAAFLLHDVFDMEFAEVGAILERSDVACRQLAARARENVHAAKPRARPSPETVAAIVAAFHAAVTTGDLAPFAARLAADCVLVSDGGGKRLAALRPILGAAKILRFLIGVAGKRGLPAPDAIEAVTLNGLPGIVFHGDEGPETIAIEIAGESIVRIYAVRNPDKLRHLT